MEGALKMVRAHGNKINAGKDEIVALENSFHGRTLGRAFDYGPAKYRHDFEPLLRGCEVRRRPTTWRRSRRRSASGPQAS